MEVRSKFLNEEELLEGNYSIGTAGGKHTPIGIASQEKRPRSCRSKQQERGLVPG
jgi:hypothetical protein